MNPAKIVELPQSVQPASAVLQGLETQARCAHPEASVYAADMLRNYAMGGSVGIDAIVANIAALAQAQQAAISLDDSVLDWNMMFRAVEDRLTAAVGKVLVATPGLEPQTAAELVQTIVLECVTALGQLQVALTKERGQREGLEQETAEAQSALAVALANASPRRGSDLLVR